MDSFEWNKIAGAVLFALLVTFGVSAVSDLIFETERPESPGYVIAIAEEGTVEGEGAPAAQPIGVLLASADPAAGEVAAKKCGACHTFGSGEANKVGPNLFDIVMRPIATHEGYEYSDAMHAFAEQAQAWDFQQLNGYLTNPKGVVPGTKMAFAGIRNDTERANVIAYLRTLSGSPKPLPPVEPAAGEAVPATEGETAPTNDQQGAAGPAADGQQVASAAPAEGADGFAAEVAAADVAKGETFAKRCIACHSFDEGGPNKVGPHLFGVVNRPVAAVPDYAYSDPMKAFSEGGAKVWDFDTLHTYLADPRGVVPGTKMVFPGIKNEADRVNVVAYLATLGAPPAPQ